MQCTLCGHPLAAADMACPTCLPNFYRRSCPKKPTKEAVKAVLDKVDALDLPDGAHWAMVHERMSNEECDVLIAVSAEPGRRMMLSEMTPRNREIAEHIVATTNHLIAFHGGWVALTDAGYDAMTMHCAHNF